MIPDREFSGHPRPEEVIDGIVKGGFFYKL